MKKNKDFNPVKILKVRFDYINLKQTLETVCQWSYGEEKYYITTPNPEILLEAQKNKKFLKILNRAELNIADGTGILWASKYLKIVEKNNNKTIKILKWIFSLSTIIFFPKYIKSVLPERVTGSDLMKEICKNCPTNIFLLGAREGIAEKAKEKLEENNIKSKITGTYAGTPLPKDEKTIIKKINNSKANILFVAYGAPAQEIWIYNNLKKLNTIKVAIGIGGAFDFIAGTRKRAPKWIQNIGLEWLFRLLQQPKRIKRIYNATIKFPFIILKTALKQ